MSKFPNNDKQVTIYQIAIYSYNTHEYKKNT